MSIINSIKGFSKYRYLLGQLVIRDFKVKYKRSVLGVLWSVLNPLFTMLILYVVFSQVFRIKATTSITNYSAYLLTGIVLFNFLSEATSLSLGAVVGNFNLITKVYMPKYIFPASKVLSSALNFVFSLLALYLIVVIQEIMQLLPPFSWANILLPYDLLCMVIFCIGLGFVLSTLTVFFRDMFYIWGVVMTAWMYLTPIMYPISLIEDSKSWWAPLVVKVMKINPLYQFISFARSIIMDGVAPSPMRFVYISAWALFMLLIGGLLFRSKQDKFIYYI